MLFSYLEKEIFKGDSFRIRKLSANIFREENPLFHVVDSQIDLNYIQESYYLEKDGVKSVICGHLQQITKSMNNKRKSDNILLL